PCGLLVAQAVKNLGAREKDRARAGDEEHFAADPGVLVEIGHPPRHCADAEGVDDQARLEPRLDHEEPSNFFPHPRQSSKSHASSANPRLRVAGLWLTVSYSDR